MLVRATGMSRYRNVEVQGEGQDLDQDGRARTPFIEPVYEEEIDGADYAGSKFVTGFQDRRPPLEQTV